MPAPLPADDSRPGWFFRLDGFVLDIHRSGFLSSLIVHIVALMALATFCLGTDPAARRVACVVAFEGSGADALDEGTFELAADAAGEPDTAAAPSPVAEIVDATPLAADIAFDGSAESREDIAVASGSTLATELASGAGSGKGAGKELGAGTATFFGVEARGDEFVYVVDFSGSMEGPRIDQARYELRTSIESLAADASFFVVLFNHGSLAMPAHGLVRATRDNKQRYLDWVDRQPVGGGTNPVDALVAAARLKPDAVFLLTDGGFADPRAAFSVVARSKGPRFHTVAFHDNVGEQVLRRIARAGRGTYRFHAP